MKWLLSCFLTILLLFEGATSSDAGPVRLIPLQYWKGTPVQPTEADSCSQEASSKSGQETLGIHFNLFKGERGYGTLGDEKSLKKQAAECLRFEKLDNFQVNDAELQFTFPLSQDARCVMWFVLAMRRSGLRYTLDTKSKTFNISLHVSTKGKGCAAHALPTSGDKFRFCIVKKCDSENAIPFTSEQHVIHDSRAITPNTNLDDFCDLECRYETYQIKEAANGAQIVVKPKKGYTTLVTNPPGTTEDVQPAGIMQIGSLIPNFVCLLTLVAVLFAGILALTAFGRISSNMTKLIGATFPEPPLPEERESAASLIEERELAARLIDSMIHRVLIRLNDLLNRPKVLISLIFFHALNGFEGLIELVITTSIGSVKTAKLPTGDRILTVNDTPVHGVSGKDKILDAIESEGLVKIEVERPITEAADLLVTKDIYPDMKRVSPQPLFNDACEIGKRQSAKPVVKAEKSILKQCESRSSYQVTFAKELKVDNIVTDFTDEEVVKNVAEAKKAAEEIKRKEEEKKKEEEEERKKKEEEEEERKKKEEEKKKKEAEENKKEAEKKTPEEEKKETDASEEKKETVAKQPIV
ncbi:hypothetical protein QR680_018810 [Steinernema hermaphroditum]|uniref:PDZ domain-containing protein n=1 Tax=Steinernema hermaphroditum TaxID=289476 RepID=A0AA39HJ22_9BILA|nr:hypothetical protein QR680_018810 [Steinernema hermaphroditum]